VLERIDMQYSTWRGLVTYKVFPKSTLPNAAFVSRDPGSAQMLNFRQRSREAILYQAPTRREIGIARWQPPDCVQMIWQHHERIDRERIGFASFSNRRAQISNMVNEQGLPPIEQVDRKEPAPARNSCTTIVWHEVGLARRAGCRMADYAFG